MTDTHIEVRPAVPGDIAVLTTLLELLFAVEEDFHADAARQRRGLELMMNNPACCILVAEDEGEVIGMCSGQVTVSTAEGGLALLVEDVVVKSNRQCRGVGSRLLRALSNWAMERGISRLQLLATAITKRRWDFIKNLAGRVPA